MGRWRVDPARLIRPYTHSARVMSRTPTPYTPHSLTQEREKNVEQERGNAERARNAKEKSRNAGTRERKGPQECAPISGKHDTT